mgnify:CR=1 FL=1
MCIPGGLEITPEEITNGSSESTAPTSVETQKAGDADGEVTVEGRTKYGEAGKAGCPYYGFIGNSSHGKGATKGRKKGFCLWPGSCGKSHKVFGRVAFGRYIASPFFLHSQLRHHVRSRRNRWHTGRRGTEANASSTAARTEGR